MFKKAFKKLVGTSKKSKPAPKPAISKSSTRRTLTAEGWKRLMMKKYRKSK